MPRSFEYNGDLAVTPLAEILATIHRYGVPGVVDVTRGMRTRRIFVEDGLVVFAASNEKDMDLASYLLKQGALDAETAREAEARRARDGLRMGQVLLQMGVVTPERLNTAISGQIRAIVFDTIDWDAGDVHFEIGARRTADFVRVELPILEVLVAGIRRAANVRRFVKRLGSAVTVLEKAGDPPPALFSEAERRFYESVDGKRPLQQLCAHGPAALAENARTLYAFYCLGLLRKARGTASGARKIQYRTEGGSLGK